MHHASRPPLQRIAELDRAIRAGEFPNAGSVARRLEVCRRTIQRDLDFMRDRLGAPLAFDARRRGYAYADPTFRLPFGAVTEGELVALFLAERVLRQWRGTPYGPALGKAFKRLVAGLGEAVTIDLGELAGAFSVTTTAAAPFEPATFAELATAVLHRRRVVLDYDSASGGGRRRRAVDPYHLAQVDGQWYLIGHCHARGEVRMFVPGRVRALEVTGEAFAAPEFRIDEYLGRSLAVLRGGEGELHRVRLRFAGAAARYVGERTWHPTQAIEEQPDGGLILTLELSHLREVERWALSWGAECEVLEPAELRERVRAELTRSAARYDTPSPRRASRRPGP